MEHSILKERKSFFIYLGLWILVSLFQFYFIYEQFPRLHSKLGLVIFIENNILAALLLGSWYGIRYISLETQKPIQVFTNHLIYLMVIIGIWTLLNQGLDFLILSDQANRFKNTMQPIRSFTAVFSYLLFIAYLYLDSYYNSYLEKLKIERALHDSLKEAELNLLKTQMNPHFIFNSLNSISSLTITDANRAHDMVIKLSDFMRYTVTSASEHWVNLEKELDMCRAYLDIEKIRFGNRINFNFTIAPDTLDYKVPTMMLQTLFENAVKHGVYNSLNNETINFVSKVEKDWLVLSVINTFDTTVAPQVGTHTGLKNIKMRLNLLFNGRATMHSDSQDNIFTVTLQIPRINESINS